MQIAAIETYLALRHHYPRHILHEILCAREANAMWMPFRKKSQSQDKEQPYLSRAPRIRLHPLIHVSFLSSDGELALSNISTTGLALIYNQNPLPRPGSRLSGKLSLGSTAPDLDIVLEVVHLTKTIVGCKFIEPSPELRSRINKYFEVEIASGELIQVPQAQLAEDPEGTPIWITGKNNTELYLIVAGSRIVRFHLTFFANHVEGGEGLSLRFGKILEDSPLEKPGHKGSALIQPEANAPDELTVAAIRLIHHAPLDTDLRQKLLTLISLKQPSE